MQYVRPLANSLLRLLLMLVSSKIGSRVLLTATALLILPTILMLLAAAWLGLHHLIDAAHFYDVPKALTLPVVLSAMIAWAGVIVYGAALLERLSTDLVQASRTKV